MNRTEIYHPICSSHTDTFRNVMIQDMIHVLKDQNEKGCILFGHRGIGKTNCLKCIEQQLVQEKIFFPVYIDLHNQSGQLFQKMIQDCVKTLFSYLNIQASDSLNTHDIATRFQHDILPQILNQLPINQTLIFLFDECDILPSHTDKWHARSLFYSFFKNLMEVYRQRIKCVITIGRHPDDLTTIYLSFFKGFKIFIIPLLSHEETLALIHQSELTFKMNWSNELAEKIYQFTGGHPMLTRQLCGIIRENIPFQYKTIGVPIPSEFAEKYVSQAIQRSETILNDLWKSLSPIGQAILSTLSPAGKSGMTWQALEEKALQGNMLFTVDDIRNIVNELIERYLIQIYDDYLVISIEIFRRWIADHHSFDHIKSVKTNISPVTDHLIQASYLLYQNEKYIDAEKAAKLAVSLNPDNLEANMLLSDILLKMDYLSESINIIEKLYTTYPDEVKERLVQLKCTLSQTLRHLYSDHIDFYRLSQNNPLLKQVKIRFAEIKDQEQHLLSLYESILSIKPTVQEIKDKYIQLIINTIPIIERIKQITYESKVLAQELGAYELTESTKKVNEIKQNLRFNQLFFTALKAIHQNDSEAAIDLLSRLLFQYPDCKEAERILYVLNQNGSYNCPVDQTIQDMQSDQMDQFDVSDQFDDPSKNIFHRINKETNKSNHQDTQPPPDNKEKTRNIKRPLLWLILLVIILFFIFSMVL